MGGLGGLIKVGAFLNALYKTVPMIHYVVKV